MVSSVKFSCYVWILSSLVIIGLGCAAYVYFRQGQFTGGVLTALLPIALLVAALFYAPVSVKIDPKEVTVRSVLSKKCIPIKDIESVRLFQPTIGALRICASPGFMGYWGLFREADVGNYIAAYGRSSDCFMIQLKNGDKYVFGCRNPRLIVEEIKLNKFTLK